MLSLCLYLLVIIGFGACICVVWFGLHVFIFEELDSFFVAQRYLPSIHVDKKTQELLFFYEHTSVEYFDVHEEYHRSLIPLYWPLKTLALFNEKNLISGHRRSP